MNNVCPPLDQFVSFPHTQKPMRYNKSDNKELGGLSMTKDISNKNFYEMLEIPLVFHSLYIFTLEGGDRVPKDGAELKPGKYGRSTTHAHSYIALLICNGCFFLSTNEPCSFWTVSIAHESSRSPSIHAGSLWTRRSPRRSRQDINTHSGRTRG